MPIERFDFSFSTIECSACGAEVIIPATIGEVCIVCESCGNGYCTFPRKSGPINARGITVGCEKVGEIHVGRQSYPIEMISLDSTPDSALWRVLATKLGSPTRVLSVTRSPEGNFVFVCRARWHWHLQSPDILSTMNGLQTEVIPCFGCTAKLGRLPSGIETDPLAVLVHNVGPICLPCDSCSTLYFVNPLVRGDVDVGATHVAFGTWADNVEVADSSIGDGPPEVVRDLVKLKTGSATRMFSFATTPDGTSHLVCRAPFQWHFGI